MELAGAFSMQLRAKGSVGVKGLIFIYIMTAVGTIGGVFQPLIGLFVYVMFAMLRPQSMWAFAGDFAGISQYVALAMLIGWAIKGFGDHYLGRTRSVVISLLLFAGWTAVSATQAVNETVAFAWVVEFLKVVAPFLVGITMLTTSKLARWMLWTIVIAHGYIGYEMNSAYYFDGYNRVMDQGYGGMDNNSFGLSLVTVLGPAIALALAAKRWPERMLALVCAALILHTTILTYSRGALLGLIFVGLAAFVIIPKRPSFLIIIFVGALIGIRLAGPEVVARFSTTFAEEDDRDYSSESRVNLWKACWAIAEKNPLFGVGPRNFPVVAEDYGFTRGKEAHSTWMQTLAEMGFPGLIALLAFYGTAIVKMFPLAWQKWTEDTRADAAVAAGVLISLSGFFVSAQFVTMTGLETPYYVTMVGLAMLKNARRAELAAAATPVPAGASPRLLHRPPLSGYRGTVPSNTVRSQQ